RSPAHPTSMKSITQLRTAHAFDFQSRPQGRPVSSGRSLPRGLRPHHYSPAPTPARQPARPLRLHTLVHRLVRVPGTRTHRPRESATDEAPGPQPEIPAAISSASARVAATTPEQLRARSDTS